jgi:ribosomal protein S18 acetylase RimI-like enzyme
LSLCIKLCPVKDLIPVRHKILRTGKPISTCYFDGDNNLETFHFGAYKQNKIVGSVSFMMKFHPDIDAKKSYQLRGMAVLKHYQKQSIGLHLLQFSENHLLQQNVDLIWCNVRIKAKGFYQTQNFKIFGEEFIIPDVGPHVLMYKYI